jgi:D-amino peptidase
MKSVLIIADIEGSSGCGSYLASSFLTHEWANACVEMSLDVDTAARALFDSGVEKVAVQDFHRTAYNLLPELIDKRAVVRHGYRSEKVYGVGDPGNAEAVVFLGLHAASGSKEGFLPHTLTSRISRLEVNGRLLPEAELFSASLAPFGIRPIFFSGCPIACGQAKSAISGIVTYSIDKSGKTENIDVKKWRAGLAEAVKRSLKADTKPYDPKGPFHAVVTMRDGDEAVKKIVKRWKFKTFNGKIAIETRTMGELYYQLIRLAYLNPIIERTMPVGLWLMNLQGWFGLNWVRRKVARG